MAQEASRDELAVEASELEAMAIERNNEIAEVAREARDKAAASGTLVWDPFDPEWRRDPYSVYERLRSESPVHKSPLGFWVFTRHADCLAILRDRRASSDGRLANHEQLRIFRDRELVDSTPTSRMLDDLAPFLFRDPPDHTRLRGLVQKAFTPRSIQALAPRVQEICDDLMDEALEKGEVDLVSDYAYPLPVQIIVEMLGVPAHDHAQFREWSDALARGLDPDFLLPPDAVKERLAGILSFVQYFAGLISERRESPQDDLISRLIQAEEDGDFLSQGELISTCILLLVAGHETTVNLISGGALALLHHPDQLGRLRSDRTLARTAVEEMMRFVSPVQLTGRVAREEFEIGGAHVRTGEFSMLLIASGNRDPDVFEDPDRFDIGRAENPHLGFGFGIHHCLGAALARLETQTALTTLVARAKNIALENEKLTYKDNVVLRGLDALPVTVSPA